METVCRAKASGAGDGVGNVVNPAPPVGCVEDNSCGFY
jgi:hypothetical protein